MKFKGTAVAAVVIIVMMLFARFFYKDDIKREEIIVEPTEDVTFGFLENTAFTPIGEEN